MVLYCVSYFLCEVLDLVGTAEVYVTYPIPLQSFFVVVVFNILMKSHSVTMCGCPFHPKNTQSIHDLPRTKKTKGSSLLMLIKSFNSTMRGVSQFSILPTCPS